MTISSLCDANSLLSHALSELVDMHYHQCNEHLEAILEVELTPFTQNLHYYEASRDKFLSRYKHLRAGGTGKCGDIRGGNVNLLSNRAHRSSQHTSPVIVASSPEAVRQLMSQLTSFGYPNLKIEDLAKLNPPDVYENELRVMGEVHGYFQVAHKVSGLQYRNGCFI